MLKTWKGGKQMDLTKIIIGTVICFVLWTVIENVLKARKAKKALAAKNAQNNL